MGAVVDHTDVIRQRIGIIGICGWGGMAINAAAIYVCIAYHFYESLLNCKMIFQLLYWAYQIFFGRTSQ